MTFIGLGLGIGLTPVKGAPANAVMLNGQYVMLNGQYVTLEV